MKLFVAGGTSGIGLELALSYKNKGYEVAVCGRNLKKIDPQLLSAFKWYEVDICNKADLKNAVSDFADTELDMMIIAAGSYADDSLNKISYQESSDMLTTNIAGVVNAFEVAKDAMRAKQSGSIVVVASVSGLLNYKEATTYSKTKRAIIQIAEAYRRGLKDFGINVTVVAPGYVDTEKLRKYNNDDLSKKPFLITAQEAAKTIVEGIDRQKQLIIFPPKMKFMMLSLASLPAWMQSIIMYKKAKWMNRK